MSQGMSQAKNVEGHFFFLPFFFSSSAGMTVMRRFVGSVITSLTMVVTCCCLTQANTMSLYPEPIRAVCYYDEETEDEIVFISNNFDISALEVANLYRHRWDIVKDKFSVFLLY